MAEWLQTLPLWWANGLTLIMFIAIGAGVLLVPRASILADAPDRSTWRDIRWWALGLIAVQLGIYALFS